MILDIIIVAILVIAIIHGFRKGFVFTLIHTVGWIGSLVIACVTTSFVENFLRDNTGLYKWLYGIVNSRFDASLDTLDTSMSSIPSAISSSVSDFSTNIIDGVSTTFTNIIFTILVFICIFIVAKIILWLILRLLSKDYRGGFTGFADGIFGALFGFVCGAVVVILFITLLLPFANLSSVGMTKAVVDQLNSSLIAQQIYNENFLLIILQSLFGK